MSAIADKHVAQCSGSFERALFMCRITDATIAARLSVPRAAHEIEGMRALQLGVRELAASLAAAVAELEALRGGEL